VDNWKIAYIDNNTICTAGEKGRITIFDTHSGKDLKFFTVE